jgi:hypothetical protein
MIATKNITKNKNKIIDNILMQIFNLRHAISYLFLLVQQHPTNQSGGNKLHHKYVNLIIIIHATNNTLPA